MSVATKRKLAAILSADVTGFGRLMGDDEIGTHQTLVAHRRVMDDLIGRHHGRVVGTAGDSVLADFPSVVEAIGAAVDIQGALDAENQGLPPDRRLVFRIGINLGDVIVDGDDIYGDGVNVAARLQAMAEPGGILVSAGVYDQVRNKVDLEFRDRGIHRVKNIAEPVRVFAVGAGSGRGRQPGRRKPFWLVAGGGALLLVAALGLFGLMAPERLDLRAMLAGLIGSSEPAVDRPTIAVLPLANNSGDADQDYFSDGITEDLIAALGRFPEVSVLSRNAVAAYAGNGGAPRRLHDELGVRYVVDGSVRRSGDNVRMVVQLTDAERGVVLWSERFEERLDDIFALQDAITRRVAGSLAARLTRIEEERSFAKPTENLAAYDLVLRGRSLAHQLTRSANRQARALFESAVELDPDYALAYAELGWTYLNEPLYGWTEWTDLALQEARSAAETAIRHDDSTAEAYVVLGVAEWLSRNYEAALRLSEQALQINPSLAEAHHQRGAVLVRMGDVAAGLPAIETALRYDPRGKPNWHYEYAVALYLAGQPQAAIEVAENCIRRSPDHTPCRVILPAALAQTGRLDEAKDAAEALRKRAPFFDIGAFLVPYRSEADRGLLAHGLQTAGLG